MRKRKDGSHKMTSKKDLMEELKKFNKDLEGHLPNLELDFVKDLHSSKSSNSQSDDDYFSLLANNLMELRTEMALTRKNLSVEIEGMVLRSMADQQGKFFDQIKKFYGVIIMEMKENFSEHLMGLSDDLNSLKRKYTEVSMQNESFSNTLNDAVIDLKNIKNTLDDSTSDIKETNNLSKKKFDDFLEKMSYLSADVNKKNMYFEDKVLNINKKFSKIEMSLEELKDSLDNYAKDKEVIERNKNTFLHHRKFEDIDNDTIEEIKNSAIESSKNSILSDSKEDVSSNSRKISEINAKLERLNSLR